MLRPKKRCSCGVLLFLFDKVLKLKEATKNVNETYGEILNIYKCQRWFKQFKNGDRNLKFSLHAASHCLVARCIIVYSPDRFFNNSAFNLSNCAQ